MRGPLALGLLALLVAPTATAAPWLQQGYDAARTGATPDPGPQTLDVAFNVSRGQRGPYVGPVILDGSVFWVTQPSPDFPGPAGAAVWGVDLATAETRLLADLPDDSIGEVALAADENALYVVTDREAIALSPVDGARLWPQPYRPPVLTPDEPDTPMRCSPPAVLDGVLYIGCEQLQVNRVVDAGPYRLGPHTYSVVFVAALDTATGTPIWLWNKGIEAEAGAPADAPGATTGAVGRPADVAVAGDVVYLVTQESVPKAAQTPGRLLDGAAAYSSDGATVWALARPTGELLWQWEVPRAGAYCCRTDDVLLYPGDGDTPVLASDGREVFVAARLVAALDPGTGRELWTYRFPYEPTDAARAPSGWDMAVAGPDLFVASGRGLYRFDTATKELTWSAQLPVDLEWDWATGLVVARGVVYAIANTPRNAGYNLEDTETPLAAHVMAFSVEDGELLAKRVFEWHDFTFALEHSPRYGVGEGVFAVLPREGNLHVLGHTAASIQLSAEAGDLYPAVGAEATVDLSGTRPGVLDPDTEFRVDWGDGTVTAWGPGAVVSHTYLEPGSFLTRVEARNPAGQTASQIVLFSVGGVPPGDPLELASIGPPRGPPFYVWPLAGLALLLGAVAVVAFARARSARRASAAAPRPTADRMEIYRAALEHIVAQAGPQGASDVPLLADLRTKLGITDRDHAILEYAIVTGAQPGGPGLHPVPGETVLGKYHIKRLLGEGGYGLTFLAEDTVLSRDVAVKVLRPGAVDAEDLVREARAMGHVRHPNVVTIHDVDRVGEGVFVVMEYMEGGSLKARLSRGPVAPDEFLALARDLLAALTGVHASGVVHRDVKPANLLLTADGRAKLADFGIAELAGIEATMAAFRTMSGAVGTIPYMSPEQAKGHRVTLRSDLYSAAAVLYEVYTGKPVVEARTGESVVELQMRVAAGRDFDRPLGGPPELRAWFAHALAPASEGRFASAHEMLGALERALGVEPSRTPGRLVP